ncbi:MAG: cyclodeaminase/cyclohydrolase family protein [Chloroflexota bacterium]
MTLFVDKTVAQFLDELASKEPVPGGGSASALGAALGAALVSMVCQLTIGKKGYEAAESELRRVLARSEMLRREVTDLLQADTEVYAAVMAAYRLPRKNEEHKAARHAALQAALKDAAEVPHKLAERSAEILALALPAAQLGNPWAVSDAAAGALLAEACIHAALLNVHVNLASIADADFAAQARARIAVLTAGKAELKDQVLALVHAKIAAPTGS